MIRCAVCRGRIRPPNRAWTEAPQGVSFYKAAGPMERYHKALAALARRIPFVHERCRDQGPRNALVALDLGSRLDFMRRMKGTHG